MQDVNRNRLECNYLPKITLKTKRSRFSWHQVSQNQTCIFTS